MKTLTLAVHTNESTSQTYCIVENAYMIGWKNYAFKDSKLKTIVNNGRMEIRGPLEQISLTASGPRSRLWESLN